jgi:hypothetical protein
MTDYYLKFTDEAAANAVLFTTVAEIQDEHGEVIVEASVTANYTNISVIGVITKMVDATETTLEGWHVNVRAIAGEDADALTAYAVQPTIPHRVWA